MPKCTDPSAPVKLYAAFQVDIYSFLTQDEQLRTPLIS